MKEIAVGKENGVSGGEAADCCPNKVEREEVKRERKKHEEACRQSDKK